MNNCSYPFTRMFRAATLGLGLLMVTLAATPAGAQPNTAVIPYLGTGYKYKQVSYDQGAGFESPGFPDGDWPTGNAGFGTIGPTCPINTSAFVKTLWSRRTDILLRKRFMLPAGTRNLTVGVAIGNDVQVFLNGRDISGGLLHREGCAEQNSLMLRAPDSLLLPGDNLIAVRGRGKGNETYLDIEVRADVPVTYTITASAMAGGTISPSGAVTVTAGGSQSFAIAPNVGYHVDSVLVDGVNAGAISSYTFTNVTSNGAIAAYFSINRYTITASSGPGGSISPAGSVVVAHGSSALFSITPATGYHLDSLIVNGVKVDSTTSYTFTNVTAAQTIRAVFAINQYVITASAGANGAISPIGMVTVEHGGSRTFTLSPAPGYHVDSLIVDGVKVDSTTSYTFVSVTSHHTIRSVFALNRYAITATAGAHGAILPSGVVLVNHGASQTFTITPDLYYYIQDVVVDGVSLGPISSYEFTAVTTPHTIAASFYTTAALITSLADSGSGTLRDAITITNTDPYLDSIKFTLPGSGIRTITLSSSLPIVTDSLVIDGYTQPESFGPATSTESGGGPLIQLNGNGVADHGLILAANNVTVRGIIINRCLRSGILVTGADATIEGNYLGTDSTGTHDLGNGMYGIWVQGAVRTNIGAVGHHGANVVSGNGISGVFLESAAGTNVTANLVGTDVTGTHPLGNSGHGITISSGSSGIVIGPGNTIAYNSGSGVAFPHDSRTAVLGNSIFDNGGLGIDIGGDGVTPGAPVLRSAAFDLKTVGGILSGHPSTTYRLEFFESSSPDPSGFGEGQVYLGSGMVTTDSTGLSEFYLNIPGPMDSYRFVTATATDADNATSEFSGAIQSMARVKIFGEHYVINTTFSGIPLHWPEGSAAFQISNGVPGAFHDAVIRGYQAWDSLPQLGYVFDGTTDNTTWGGPADGRNLAVWVTHDWEALTGLDSTAVAVTRTRYNALNGEITDADIAFDADHFSWEISSGMESSSMDVENVTAHEAGHFGGLGDIYNPGDPGYLSIMGTANEDVTMYGLIAPAETSKRSLEDPDSIAIASLYALVPPSRVDLVMVFDPSDGYSITQGAFEPSRNSALELIPKMRSGDRLGIVLMPSTVALPLTPMDDSTGRAQAIAAISGLLTGGQSAVGSGLQTAQGQLDLSPRQSNARTILLYSAGEENAAPSALSVLPPILAARTRLFTLGFSGSYGQNLCSQLADTTGGGYHIAADSTINQAVNEIWNTLTSQQYSFFTLASSDTFQSVPFPGITWQGPVDKGSTTALPGIQWQGPKTLSLANAPEAVPGAASYVLTLVPPGGGPRIDSAYAANNPALGITFFGGETYQYFLVKNPAPGNWMLSVYQRSGPTEIDPVLVSVTAVTDLVMQTSLDQLSYAPDQTVTMDVTLSDGGVVAGGRHITGGGPVTDATVTALVSPPGSGIPVPVLLSHRGAGVYQGAFSATSTPGTYNVAFTATRDTIQRTAAQSFYVVPVFDGRAVLLANRSINMDPGAVITSGDIIVNGTRPTGGYELVLGDHATTPAGYDVKASDILVNQGAVIAGTVTYNLLVNQGTITGTLQTPLVLPVLSALPPFKAATPGSTNITVKTRKSLTLAAGHYGNVDVEPSATLVLSGGMYHFRSLTVKSKAKLVASAAVELRVLNGCNADNEAYFGPAQGSLIDARRIVIYVSGADGTSSTYPQAVTISPYGRVYANIYAPFGTIALRQGGIASGAFIANDLTVGQDASITLASAFAPGLNAAVRPWALEPVEERQEADLPGTFTLGQNFPNPFNPTTTIRYQLAEAAPVSLVVFDVLGQVVRTLVKDMQESGSYDVTWDGRNNSGQALGSGIFYYRLQAGAFVETRAMTLLK